MKERRNMSILKNLFGTGTVFGENKADAVRQQVSTVENITPWIAACRREIKEKIKKEVPNAEVTFQYGTPANFGWVPVKVNGIPMAINMHIMPDMRYEYILNDTRNSSVSFGKESFATIPEETGDAWEIGIREDIEMFLKDRFKSAAQVSFKTPENVNIPFPVTVTLQRGIEFHITMRIEYDKFHKIHIFSILEDEIVKRKPNNAEKTAEELAEEWLANNSSYIFALLQDEKDVVSIPAKKLPSDEEVLKLIQIQLSKTGQFDLVSFNEKTGDLDLCKVTDEDF